MRIYKDKHYNMNCIIMEREEITLKLIPEIGFKMASLKYKDKEFLFQPANLEYRIPEINKPFMDFDTSGLDEMIPTIDRCIYDGIELPDHGDVWSIPWDVTVAGDKVTGRVKLRSLPLEFIKTISILEKSSIKDEAYPEIYTIRMDYCVKNTSPNEQSYLWALHGLNKFNDDTEIILPNGVSRILDVINNKVIDKNINGLVALSEFEDKKSYKYYILDELSNGECGLYYKDCGIKYMIKFDKTINPYLGIWITKGGFKGEYNCALEPSNGFYDSLQRAKDNNKYERILPLEEKKWTIFIEIKKG